MRDRNVQYPARYRMTKVAGTDDIYEMEPVPGEVTDEGTIINKAALLKDATAALFGFTAEQIPDTVPDDVLAILSKAVLLDEYGNLINTTGETAGVNIATGSYVGTGTSGSENPNSLTFNFQPQILFIIPTDNTDLSSAYGIAPFIRGSSSVSVALYGYSSMSTGICGVDFDGNTVKWWYLTQRSSFFPSNAHVQMNVSGEKYNFVAFG